MRLRLRDVSQPFGLCGQRGWPTHAATVGPLKDKGGKVLCQNPTGSLERKRERTGPLENVASAEETSPSGAGVFLGLVSQELKDSKEVPAPHRGLWLDVVEGT